MFKVFLNDKEIEAVNGTLKHSENKASTLTFKLLPNSEFFTNIQRFLTKAKVFDDENEVFDGWVVGIEESMTNSGEFAYKVTCLSALDYLNCVSTGKWDLHPDEYTPEEIPTSETENLDPFEVFENVTVKKALEMALKKHNDNVTDDKKIFLGNVTVEDTVYMQSNRAKVLNLIQRIAEKKEAFIEIRKKDGKYYLDFLKEVEIEENEIVLGVNMTSISRENTLENVITRIIPIGADGLTIKSVNNGKEYVDNEELKAIYGVNDTVITWDDVTIADNLKQKAIDALETINNETFSISTSAIDLSYINNDYVRFQKSQMVQIYNPVLKINEKYRIIEIDINLDTPYESSLTFSNAPCSTIETVNSMESSITETKTDYEKVNDKLIRKISKDDVETIVTQSAESWKLSINGKLKGTNYNFDGEGMTVTNGDITVKNADDEMVMWVDDETGLLSVNSLKVFGEGNNTVNFEGKGGKSINFKSDDAKSLFMNFLRGSDTCTRIGVYAQDALSERSYQLFIEPGSNTSDNEPMVIVRGANSTEESNESAILQVHGDVEAIRGLYVGQGESKMNVLEEINKLKAAIVALGGTV